MPIRNPRRLDVNRNQPAFPQPPVAPRLYRNIAVTFLGLTIVIIGAVLWMSSVKATVRIRVKRDTTKIDSTVEIAKSPDQGQLQGRVVEGTFDNIQEFKVQEQTSTTVDTVTTGRVRIVNNYSKAQPLVKTTRLVTSDGKLFRINATVSVPSGQAVEVDAYSDQPGAAYAIGSGTKFTIPGLWIDLQKWIYAESVTAFAGGSKTVKTVGASDISEAQKSLEASVVEQAKKTLIAEAGIPADKLADDCPEDQPCWQGVYFITPVEKKTNVTAGQESDAFLAQVKVKVTGVFYPKRDMDLLVRTKLKERLPDGRDLVDFDPSRVIYRLETADTSAEKARIGFIAEASSRLTDQSPALSKDAIAGMSVDDAKAAISKIEGVEFVEVTLRPSWARKIPTQKNAIDVTIE